MITNKELITERKQLVILVSNYKSFLEIVNARINWIDRQIGRK